MKHCHPCKPVPPLDELEAKRRYFIAELETKFNDYMEKLNALSPDELETLHEAVKEFREIKESIDVQLDVMKTTLDAYSEINKYKIVEKYDTATRSLVLSVGKD